MNNVRSGIINSAGRGIVLAVILLVVSTSGRVIISPIAAILVLVASVLQFYLGVSTGAFGAYLTIMDEKEEDGQDVESTVMHTMN